MATQTAPINRKAKTTIDTVSSSDSARKTLQKLEDTTLLAETIKVCKGTTKQIEKTAIYLDECRVRFDNRGKPGRIIDGYKGFLDFLDRGCGIGFREAYRIMERYFEPGKVAERNKQRRAAAKGQKAQPTTRGASAVHNPVPDVTPAPEAVEATKPEHDAEFEASTNPSSSAASPQTSRVKQIPNAEPAPEPTASNITAILTTLSLELGLKLSPFTKSIEKASELNRPDQTDIQTLICSLRKISKDLAERADRLDAACGKSQQEVAA
jgi:hypothetical protein